MKKMKNTLRLLISFAFVNIALCVGLSALASERLPSESHLQKIAVITNTKDTSVATLSIVLDASDAVLGVYNSVAYNDGSGKVDELFATVDEIRRDDGAVLMVYEGHDLFLLQGEINPDTTEAQLKIEYLSNGLTGDYSSCQIHATRKKDGNWALVNAYNGNTVYQIRAKAWTLGIKTIENVCPDSKPAR